MKIGLTGTHSTGKTTLLNALMSEKVFKNYYPDVNATRWIKDIGFKINEEGDSISQELIMIKRVATLFTQSNLIADRTVIDVMAYTQAGYEDERITEGAYKRILDYFINSFNEYDFIFLIRPEFELVDDGTRSLDLSYQEKIKESIDSLIAEYEIPNVHLITGSVRERVAQVLKIMELL